MNRRKIIALVCCGAIALSVILGGCGKSDSTPDEVETTPAVSTEVSVTTTAPATKAPKTEEITKAHTEAQTQAQQEEVFIPDYNYDVEDDYDNSDEPCTVNVDGKTYTCYIGDVVNYVFYLKTPEALEDFQATTNYDSSTLELIESSAKEMFPVAGEIVIYNTDILNSVKFNAVNLNGMDFTNGGNLVSLKFKVIDSGSAAISTTLEYMDSVKSEPYVNDFRIVGDIKYSEEII
ncbi:MAG: hypothetical protein IKK10_02755 [Clostridia bacterium]|nr:hypothetical protein [Clostridia bacterium]